MSVELPFLAGYIEQAGTPDTIEQAVRERNAWIESAAIFSCNEDYYRSLLDRIAQFIGLPAYTAADGTVYDTPVRARLPELVEALGKAAGT